MKIKASFFKKVSKKAAGGLVRFLEIVGSEKAVIVTVLVLTYATGVMFRILPARWGIYLNEFDPFYEYYLAKKIAEKGWGGILWWFSWWFDRGQPDKLFWYPYGRDLRASSEVGISMISAIIYLILKSLDLEVSLYVIHALVPVFFASLIPLTLYLLASEINNKPAGLFAASLSAVSTALLTRTPLGGKHESVAMPFMILSMYFFIKAIKDKKPLWGAISGIFLGFMAWSWGAYLYAWNMIALYTLTIWILGRSNRSYALSYVSFYATSAFMLTIFPRIGYRVTFLSLSGVLPLIALVISITEIFAIGAAEKKAVGELFKQRKVQVLALLCIIAIVAAAWYAGILKGLSGRIMAIIFPSHRGALVESVQEHRIPTWSMLYSDYGFLTVIAVAGAALAIRKWREEDMFLVLFFITSLYAAASMARLTLLLAPAIYICAALGIWEILEAALRQPRIHKKEKANLTSQATIIAAAVLILALVASSFTIFNTLYLAEQPPLIATSSLGHSPLAGDYNFDKMDWIAALEWMKTNLPKNSVIACWWDYGYWIAVNTNMSTICDNATLNSTQIELMARAFLSNESEALKIFRRLGADYVVVFQPFVSAKVGYITLWYPAGGGDFEKSYTAMVKIAGLNESKYFAWIRVGGTTILAPANTPEARNATLFRLVFIRTPQRVAYVFNSIVKMMGIPVEGNTVDIPPPEHFKLVYMSPRGWVLVYKVEYPKS
ncbi:MAG: hypothetical protein DRN04_00155 [Thermoprotei archaeon]|nr:MAG: hypothetical protein DRN04_00155 [Thermoprotei archaeon]